LSNYLKKRGWANQAQSSGATFVWSYAKKSQQPPKRELKRS
jgi:hypothetical protein